MHKAFPDSINRLIKELSAMPGIGPRSAERITFHILQSPRENIIDLLNSIKEVKTSVRFCGVCSNLSDGGTCGICSDPARDRTRICVVEGPGGITAMERSGAYRGLYHVLLGALSPIDGVGPDELRIGGLLKRLSGEGVAEIILATDFTTGGETTAMYLKRALEPFNVTVTRLSRGVPVGGSLEYVDIATLQRAFEDRRKA
ncbi:MAG: recombination protein RecR [Candidatus Omnitrophica bacterium]|nr:recombination protein RecR [Candidatus Omnitrophota bacterium]